METVLATVLGSHVNLLKGEGNELTRAARALFLGVSGGMLVWNYILSCKLINTIINSLYIYIYGS